MARKLMHSTKGKQSLQQEDNNRAAIEKVQLHTLEAVFESMTDGVFIYDRTGNIIRTNTAARKILHIDEHSDYIKTPVQQRMRQLQIRSEDGVPYKEDEWAINHILRGETIYDKQAHDVLIKTLEGQDIYLSVTGSPMRDQQGSISGAVMVFRDITERRLLEKRVERAFHAQLNLLKDLFTFVQCEMPNAPINSTQETTQIIGQHLAELIQQALDSRFVGIAYFEPNTELLIPLAVIADYPGETSEELRNRIAGTPLSLYVEEEIVGRLKAFEVAQGDILAQPGKPELRVTNALFAPMVVDNELKGVLSVRKKHSSQKYTPEEIDLVKAVAAFVVLVLERERWQQEYVQTKDQEQALAEANRRFDEFLSIASHELRTPLTTIGGNIQLAQRRLNKLKNNVLPLGVPEENFARVEEPLCQANQRINVQNRMINDLLAVSRIQANRFSVVLKPCDLAKIVRSVVEDQRYSAPQRTIHLELPEEAAPVQADEERIAQVVHNYITNALKYSPPEAPVEVRLERNEHEAKVLVKDEGPGINEDEQERIWERFQKASGVSVQSTVSSGGGLGLGLYICRIIIQRHHGSYGVESKPGEGSTFWFSLPLAT